jgi:hypothetical protein
VSARCSTVAHIQLYTLWPLTLRHFSRLCNSQSLTNTSTGVNNCVAVGNHKLFMLFIGYTAALCVYALILQVISFGPLLLYIKYITLSTASMQLSHYLSHSSSSSNGCCYVVIVYELRAISSHIYAMCWHEAYPSYCTHCVAVSACYVVLLLQTLHFLMYDESKMPQQCWVSAILYTQSMANMFVCAVCKRVVLLEQLLQIQSALLQLCNP